MPTSPVTRRDYLITGAIAARGTHTVALKADGTVWTWGTNSYGELGDGTTDTRVSPVQVPSLTGVAAIAAGANHTLAVKGDGTLWAWGRNTNGQIGDNTSGSNRLSPVQVSGLTNVVGVAAGTSHSLALLADGTVKSWGSNGNGRLGDNSTTQRPSPVSVSSLSSIVAIAAGADHSLAVKADGSVMGWGSNASGQLGAATPSQSLVPMAVPNVVRATAVSAGNSFSYAAAPGATPTSAIWSSGLNSSGQLGDGSLTLRQNAVAGPSGARWIAAGDRHGVAFRQDGSLVSWGAGDYGQLGDGSTAATQPNPVPANGAGELIQLAAGNGYTAALRADGSVLAWGAGGALGMGDQNQRKTPTRVPSFTVAANSFASLDFDGDGLPNAAEYRFGSDPLERDSNQDGIPDGAQTGGDGPVVADTDGDGLANWREAQAGSDPLVADTDRDGTVDGVDCYPLDDDRSTCGSADPNDHTAPTITLIEPLGAVLLP
jgi:alpha-tubulin suppressor-like RCC1 family protein